MRYLGFRVLRPLQASRLSSPSPNEFMSRLASSHFGLTAKVGLG